ncbi:MAG: ferritin-like domain-containing protein [Polyangiaceae bacterium]
MCTATGGICVPAGCQTGADCAPGEECNSWDPTYGCLYLEFQCTTASDLCGGDADCTDPSASICAIQLDGSRQCSPGGCAIGRPFLVADTVRTAPIALRMDWASGDTLVQSTLIPGDPRVREALAREWARVGQLEHASIAAFARFTMQLLALGAPFDLIERTQRAIADETRHARLAFGLASRFGLEHVGPAALSIDGALDGCLDLASVVALVLREGCIGETVAAVEAAEAGARCEDAALASILESIAADESTHAELAWRTVRWALSRGDDSVRAVITRELAMIASELDEAIAPVDEPTPAHLRRETLRLVVAPCLATLLSTQRTPDADSGVALTA